VKELVEYIATSLVDDPSEVRIQEFQRGQAINLKLHVAKEDMGRIIGKNGRVANSIRLLLRVAAVMQGKKISLDVEEPR
jgi:predicted RNA-binding protein YlqC (UPF0109 family)